LFFFVYLKRVAFIKNSSSNLNSLKDIQFIYRFNFFIFLLNFRRSDLYLFLAFIHLNLFNIKIIILQIQDLDKLPIKYIYLSIIINVHYIKSNRINLN
jgi:hypothetical protein